MSEWWVKALKTAKLQCSVCKETKDLNDDFKDSLHICDLCILKIEKEDDNE